MLKRCLIIQELAFILHEYKHSHSCKITYVSANRFLPFFLKTSRVRAVGTLRSLFPKAHLPRAVGKR